MVDAEIICRKFVPVMQAEDHDVILPEDVILQLEEVEAIRLKDLKGLDQVECAVAMGLSRPTFQRILQSARYKLATALLEGRGISIEGGNYILKERIFACRECNHVWTAEPCAAGGKQGWEIVCPQCGSKEKMKLGNGCCGSR